MSTDHPLPFIEELKNIPSIESIQDIITINNFVFSLIPWTIIPYANILQYENLEDLYTRFKNKEIGGWCGVCAEFFNIVMTKYGIPTKPYNFGLDVYQITHVGIIVTFDGMNFFFDPYLAKYYTYKGEFPLQFEPLIYLISTGQYNKIVPVYYNAKKYVQVLDRWEEWSPKDLELSVMEGFKAIGYEKIMQKFFKNQTFENLFLLEYFSPCSTIIRNLDNLFE